MLQIESFNMYMKRMYPKSYRREMIERNCDFKLLYSFLTYGIVAVLIVLVALK